MACRLAVLSFLATAGCDGRDKNAQATSAPVLQPASVRSCQIDLSGDKSDDVFFAFGMLNEFGGGGVPRGDLVEAFYCNESEAARVFGRVVAAVATEQSLQADLREERKQECLIFFYSKSVANLLNSCYRAYPWQATSRGARDAQQAFASSSKIGMFLRDRGGESIVSQRGLSDEVFFRRRALAYIVGAWTRFGRANEIRFPNGREKADLVATL